MIELGHEGVGGSPQRCLKSARRRGEVRRGRGAGNVGMAVGINGDTGRPVWLVAGAT